MIRHVVMFRWTPEATDEQKQRAAEELAPGAPRSSTSSEGAGSGQKAPSGTSIRSRVVSSAILRSVASPGSTVAAKNRAAASLPA